MGCQAVAVPANRSPIQTKKHRKPRFNGHDSKEFISIMPNDTVNRSHQNML